MTYMLVPLSRGGRGGSSYGSGVRNGGQMRRWKLSGLRCCHCYCLNCFAKDHGWVVGVEGEVSGNDEVVFPVNFELLLPLEFDPMVVASL